MPRLLATMYALFCRCKASKVALTRLWGLEDRFDLASRFLMPANLAMIRVAPPATTPVPEDAGRRKTWPAPYFPSIECQIVSPRRVILMSLLRALSTALATDFWTSLALPIPYPMVPLPSPTTTMAEKPKLRPPLTTLLTRLMWTISSLLVERP